MVGRNDAASHRLPSRVTWQAFTSADAAHYDALLHGCINTG